MYFPLVGCDDEQRRARPKDARDLREGGRGLGEVFESDDIEGGVKAGSCEGEGGEVGDGIEVAVVPFGIADGEIDSHIALTVKAGSVAGLAGPGIEHSGAFRQMEGESKDRLIQFRLEMVDPADERVGQELARPGVSHDFAGRASIMMVDPAPKAASRAATGRAASVKSK